MVGVSVGVVCCIVIIGAIYCKKREKREQYFEKDDENL